MSSGGSGNGSGSSIGSNGGANRHLAAASKRRQPGLVKRLAAGCRVEMATRALAKAIYSMHLCVVVVVVVGAGGAGSDGGGGGCAN
jgi:hypothetical protein